MTVPKHEFGHQITHANDYEYALHVDKHNSNIKWAEAIKIEIDQQQNYDA